jgi:prepilin peptidase CpaA
MTLSNSVALVACLVLFPALTAYAAATDLLRMTISNRLCLVLAAGFVVLAVAIGMPWQMFVMHLAAGLVVLLLFFGLFAAGWIGGGDAKLAAATALWFGFEPLLGYLLMTAILGGLLTWLLLQLRQAPLPVLVREAPWAQRLHAAKTGIPYGLAMAPAALLVLPETPLFHLAFAA